ncbi:MAG: nucleoside recognition domain-containing protein [Lachnospiraceae bacterium]
MKKFFLPFIFLSLFVFMLALSDTTFRGALNGLNLWLFTVLPSLLPYMIISSFMTESGTFHYLARLLSPLTCHVFHLSENCGYVILLGFLCGYPIGSKLSADMVRKKEISVTEGQILLSFCNNVSPAFLITYLIDGVIALPEYRTLLIVLMFSIPLLYGILTARLQCHKCLPSPPPAKLTAAKSEPVSLDTCIISSFENCFRLGGYIILFSILNEFAASAFSSSRIQNRLCTLLEITSGLHSCGLQADSLFRFTECTALTAFGGLCCLAQTYSMIRGSGLKLRHYFRAKLTIAAITFLVCSLCWSLL